MCKVDPYCKAPLYSLSIHAWTAAEPEPDSTVLNEVYTFMNEDSESGVHVLKSLRLDVREPGKWPEMLLKCPKPAAVA